MKAVFVLQADPYVPSPGVRALREASTLKKMGFDVEFVSWIKKVPGAKVDEPYPVTWVVRRPPSLGRGKFLARGVAYLRTMRKMAREIASANPDLIVAHDLEVLYAAVLASQRTGAPVVYDSHEDWPSLVADNSFVESVAAGLVERWLVRRVAHVVTVSPSIAGRFTRWGADASVLYSARPRGGIEPAISKESARRSVGIPEDAFVVGFVGNLHEITTKGDTFRHLLYAACQLRKERVVFAIVGGPDDIAKRLRERVRAESLDGVIRVQGFVPYESLGVWYSSLDAGLILLDPRPNHFKSLPNKLFDYMARGIPVIAPDFPDLRQVIQGSGCGMLMHGWASGGRPDDVILAETVKLLAGNRDVARVAGSNGKVAFETRFSWDVQEEAFRGIVEGVMAWKCVTCAA